jgi:hypothetical protein
MSENADGSFVVTSTTRPGLPNPFCVATGGAAPTHMLDCAVVEQIREAWDVALASLPVVEDRIALIGSTVRLAYHDAGEFDGRWDALGSTVTPPRPVSDPYGPDGCLTEAGDHAGLNGALDETNVILEPIWQDFCASISRADFWVLAATFALWGADPTGTLEDILPVTFGRVDNCNCDAGEFVRNATTGIIAEGAAGRMHVDATLSPRLFHRRLPFESHRCHLPVDIPVCLAHAAGGATPPARAPPAPPPARNPTALSWCARSSARNPTALRLSWCARLTALGWCARLVATRPSPRDADRFYRHLNHVFTGLWLRTGWTR